MRGLYGKVLLEVFRTDQAMKEQGLCDKNQRQHFLGQAKQARLVRDLLYIWLCYIAICSDFVEKTRKHLCWPKLSSIATGGFW